MNICIFMCTYAYIYICVYLSTRLLNYHHYHHHLKVLEEERKKGKDKDIQVTDLKNLLQSVVAHIYISCKLEGMYVFIYIYLCIYRRIFMCIYRCTYGIYIQLTNLKMILQFSLAHIYMYCKSEGIYVHIFIHAYVAFKASIVNCYHYIYIYI
jgi:hypothetical protein